MLSEARQELLRRRLRGEQVPRQDWAPRPDGPIPLSFAQQRLWFLDQMEPGSAEYTVPTTLRLSGDLDAAALGRTLSAIVSRHEVLRTRLVAGDDGVPYQQIDPPAEFPLPVADVSGADDPASAARALAVQDEAAPFDLAAGPLIRACLIRLGDDDHVLNLLVHHVVFDEWSAGILWRELAALYDAFHRGEPDPLPSLPVQYADFAVWQRTWLTGDVLDEQLGYWRRQLAGTPVLELPEDRPRPPVRSTAGATIGFTVPAETAGRLRELARDAGATMFMTLFAAYAILLGRYCGQEDVVAGTPVANRNRAETEALIGFFLNTVVLRADLSGDPAFGEVLRRVRETALGAYAHQDVPFEQLVDALVTERDRSRTPLFQAFFDYGHGANGSGANGDRAHGEGAAGTIGAHGRHLRGLAVRDFATVRTTTKFDLMMALGEADGGLAGEVRYSTELFDPATAEQMTGHLVTVLAAAVADPGRPLSRLELVAGAERRQLLGDWNDTALSLPAVGGIHELIAARAADTPDAAAVVCGAATLTYGQLEARTSRLAHHLRAAGVRAETIVGLCLERGPDMVTAVLAVWQAGGAYLPLDTAYPAGRLAFMLADSGATVLVGHREAAGSLTADTVVWLDDPAVRAALRAAPAVPPEVTVRPDQLAYMTYTSGSTGVPKGVQVTHRGVLNRLTWIHERFGLAAPERVLHKTPLTFDASVWELLWPLAAGAELVVAEPGLHGDLDYLVSLLESRAVGVVQFVPSLFRLFVTHPWPSALPSLRLLCCGGEALAAADVAGFYARNATATVVNLYGPTETTIDAASTCCERQEAVMAGTVPIGRPLSNVRLLVLDARLGLVPAGVAGELFIGGTGVTRGYGGRPALTAERFVADPYAGDGSRLYRSGDRVRWLADGRLKFLGRIDHQVKVRGFRIEPGEIEAALAAHPDVAAAAVAAHGDETGRLLAAYLVPADPAAGIPGPDELRGFLRQSLPDHMLPGVFTELAALPLTANGKLDRAALPAPDRSRYGTADSRALPRTPAEEVIAAIWAHVLAVPRVGATDNFFELGGHSLTAVQVVTRLRAAFDRELTLAALFEHPTVAGLAALIDESAPGVLAPPIVPVPHDRPLPMSFAQQRLWFLDQLEPGSADHNIPAAWRLLGPLDSTALRQALEAIVARHEVLRTRLVTVEGLGYQVIDPVTAFPLHEADLSREADPVGRARELAAAEAAGPFDLATGPLLRGRLFRLGDEDHVLVLVTHHVVSDGWSVDIFRRELSALYAAFRSGQPAPLEPLPVQYADYAVWQRDWLAGDVLQGLLDYWRARLAAAPVLDLPADRPRPAVRSSAGDHVPFRIPDAVISGLRGVAQPVGATMFMTLLSSLAVLLGRYADTDDVIVGTPVANRDRAEVEGLIGFFVNNLVLRVDLSGDPAFTELLARGRGNALAAYAHQELPFEQLVDALRPQRDRGRHPLFQVMITYESGRAGALDFADLTLRPLGVPVTSATYDLTVAFGEREAGVAGNLSYSKDLFDRSTAERMTAHLLTLLQALADRPDQPLSRVPMVAPGERDQLIRQRNDTSAAETAASVLEMVTASAARRPDASALVFGGRTMTYAALQDRAARLAHYLLHLGVGPETVVGLHLDAGPDMVTAILAVLQAGGAYLPLDPAYPAGRLAGMLTDSRAIVLIGDERLARLPVGGVTRLVRLDDEMTAEAIRSRPGVPPPRPVRHSGQAAYVIYTSGSTGRPKGVTVSHRGLANLVAAQRHALDLGEDDIALQMASFSFDVAGQEVFTPLAAGARILIAGPQTRLSASAFGGLLRASGVTVAQIPPAALANLDPGALPGLRVLSTGGEPCPPALAAAWAHARRFVNAYGPTETTVCATLAIDPETVGPLPIGRPIRNTRTYVLDRSMQPVPVGVPGELHIAGAGVARGYDRQPGLTARRFVPDPFAADGSRLYRSGDRVRWRPDGQLEFLGRADQQVKLHGHRIEPGEIEAALAAHPMIGSAVVVPRDDDGRQRLVAYVIPAGPEGGIPGTSDLRAFLSATLPGHMIPAVFTPLRSVPLTPSGKIDRDALPAPGSGRPDLSADFAEPRGDAEQVLTEVWAKALGIDRVGVDDNFFELGGDSIVSIQVVARARALGVYITPAQLFDHQTVAGLAAVATRETAAHAEQGPVVGEFPLSPIQRWFLGQDLGEPAYFNQSMLLEVTEPVEPGLLRVALSALLAQHDALRSRYTCYGGEWTGRNVAAEPNEVLWVVDAADADDWDERAYLSAHATAANGSLDLEQGPLVRFVLFNRGSRRQLLLAVAHHLVMDGVSWPILLEDLSAAYGQAERGDPVRLAPKTTSFKRWSERLTELARAPELTAEAGYWRATESAGGPLPRDHDGANVLSSAQTLSASLSAGQTARLLHEVPAAFRTQINDILLTALGAVLTEWSHAPSVLVDLEAHGREDLGPDIDVSRTVGWFTSFYPVVLVAADRADPGAALRRTKEYLRAVPRHGLGYGLLRYLTDSGLTANPEVSFNYLGQFDQAAAGSSGARLRPLADSLGKPRSDDGRRTHLIEINSEVANGRLAVAWSYSSQVHDEATVAQLARRYVTVLGELIDHCCSPGTGGYTPSDFPLAGLGQQALDLIKQHVPTAIADIYPLTALQQGMLFHSRLEPESGMYWVQNGLLLDGHLDLRALWHAWELVFARHAVLRSTVVWDGVPEPLSVVSRSVPLPWQELDLSGLDEAAQRRVIAGYLAADRAQGADFSQPTVVRLALVRLGDDRYQLVWSYHHLLLDGWSVPVVLGEVLEAYRALRAGTRPPERAHRPFRDFVAWAAGQDPAEAERYWRERLAGITAATPLGVARATGLTGQDDHEARLPAAGLADFARRHRLTVNTVVQGAWALLMSVYGGTDDVVFGVTTSGRDDRVEGMETMVGLLINTTPARVRVDPGQPVAAWLAGLQRDQVEARRFEHTSLVAIAACTGIPPGQPLFTSLFVFENYPADALEEGRADAAAGGLRAKGNFGREQPNYPLTIVPGPGPGPEFSIRMVYDRGHFDGGTIERMAGHLVTLLEAIAAGTGQRVGDLRVLTAAEREQVLVTWNQTPVLELAPGGVHELVAEHAARRPEAAAVVYPGRSLTYAELDDRANRLARHLRGLGVGAETVVGLCLERGPDLVVAMLAVWKAGGAYLPLDPGYPAERLSYMLADSGAAILVSGQATDAAGDGAAVVRLDDPRTMAEIAACPPGAPATVTHPGQLAYVIYTSGSTGRPKGISIAHRDIAALVAPGDYITIEPDDVVAQTASTSYDAAVFEIWGALANGAALAGIGQDVLLDPQRLLAEIGERQITVLFLITALFNRLAAEGPHGLRGVRHLLFGGEAADQLSVRRMLALGRPGRLLHFYGPAEATTFATWHPVTRVTGTTVPIGAPVAGMRAYVVDRRMTPVPIGVPGELYLGGLGVARGYQHRPALTAQRFVPDPFTGDGTRLYRTGDVVRWLPEGALEFLGRVDDQVKVRGFRIEPGEIEAALTAHPGIAAALVIAWSDGGDRRLAAYLVPADASAGVPAAGDLRAFLRASLPAHMIPAAFVELAAFPLTANGKIDRAALPPPDAAATELAGEFVAPATPAQELLASIWAQVLGVDRVGTGDSFFDLGGHSLLASQVISRIRDVFGVELPLAALFDQPTIAGLAAIIAAASPGAAAPPVTAVGRDQVLPLSFAQQRLWFLDQLEPGSAEYNLPMPARLEGDLDVATMGAALTAITARHEILRTRLVAGPDGVAHQVIDPPAPFPLPVADVSAAPDPEAAARALLTADAMAPFSLAAGPLIRACLIRLGPADHLLAMCVHHVVSDEWSGRILRGELAALYEAFRRGEPDPLSPLPVQYADFAVWQRAWLTTEVLDAQLAYWRDRLAGAPVLELPADRPRRPVRSTVGAVARFSATADVTRRLREVARDGGATMFMTLLAAYAVVLGRYCGAEDVTVGTPVANRSRAETEGLIGFFVNTLVMRADLSGDPTFTGLLGRVREAALGAYAHQDVPFEQLVDALVTDRDRSRTPLFQVFLAHTAASPASTGDGQDGGAARQAGAASDANAAHAAVPVKFDLSVMMHEVGTGLSGGIEYSTALFDAATVTRMAGHLLTVLEEVAADPGRRLSGLPVVTAAEREQLLVAWNDTAAPVPGVGGVHELVAAVAAGRPDAVAVVHGQQAVTYKELAGRAGRLAHHLRAAGAGAQTVVGLCLPRGIEMVAAMLAVWQTGAAYLPLDADYPVGRLAYMLADSGAPVLVTRSDSITRSGLAGRLGGDAPTAVMLDDPRTAAAVANAPAAFPAPVARPGQLAYVIYTSGSTGHPKGVQVSHANLANFLATMAERPGLAATDVLLAVTTLGFDIAGLELVLPLVTGARVVVADRDTARSPRLLAQAIAQHAATVLQATPATWQMLAGDGWDGAAGLRALCGGEALSPALAAVIAGRSAAAWNMYGPTETTIWSTCQRLDDGGRVTLGTPVANTRVYVLDAYLGLVPAGVASELFIAGAGVAQGYRGRPGLTAERFVADPFAGDGSRMYRTGDVVRWNAAGQLEFAGRADDQVKIRGFRVELGEVETVLAAHPAVAAAAVAVRGEGTHAMLAAFLVPAGDAGIPPAAELRSYAGQRLPGFMVPSVFTELAALPLTPNGKLDRAALPAPDTARPGPHAEWVPPSTPAEELLAGIWARVLGTDRVGATDGFFELGGHSLLATQVISRVREVFGVEVPLAALFDLPTVGGLAAVIQGASGPAAVPVTPAERDEPLPLSFGQQRLWFLDQLEPGSVEYNLPMPVRLAGHLDAAALGAALTAIVARHEVLRTRLVTAPDGSARQQVDPPSPFPLPVADLSGAGDPDALARTLLAAGVGEPFNLSAGPLIRAVLIRLGPADHILALDVHHVATDEWSGRILRRELSELYHAFRRGEPNPLPPLRVQYADFAVWQRAWLAGGVLDAQLSYWRDQLDGAPVLELPADRPRPPVRSTAGAAIRFTVPADVAGRLRGLARDGGATMFMTLLAAFTVLLGRYTGLEDVVAGTPVANRNRAETEDLIGFFVNTLVIRVDLSGDPGFTELLTRVRRTALDAYAHQDLPFEQLVDALVTERERSRTPLFQVLFNYAQGGPGGAQGSGPGGGAAGHAADLDENAGASVPAGAALAESRVARFDMTVTLGDDTGGELAGVIGYSTALFDATTVQRMAGHLTELLAGVAADPGAALSRLPLLTAAEREQLLTGWNATAAALPPVAGVHELVAAQAAATPAATAVVAAGEALSYAALAERAARLAGYLRGLGTGPDTVVGLCLERGADMVAAVLAVWQAGAAYLPLDPDYPPERLAFMLADSGARLLIGHRRVAGTLAVGWPADQVAWLDDPEVTAALAATPPAPPAAVAPGQLAYVIYTSGSTGTPKGVQVSHGAVLNYVARCPVAYPGVTGLTLVHAPLAFDAVVTPLWGALSCGGCVHLAALDEDLPAARRAAGLGRYTFVKITPALLPVLAGLPAECSPSAELMVGGDVVQGAEIAAWRARHPDVTVIDHYGPTETTVGSTDFRIEPGHDVPAGALPVGRPVWNTRVHVLDRHLRLVPAGVAGELYIGGAGLARGYGGRPALTAERFVADPFAGDGSRLYRTGDQVRWRPDEALEFLGRADNQVKIRGYRVETGEIEAVLAAHPGVRSAVAATSGHHAARRLVAYLVPADPAAGLPPAGELRAYLVQHLPEFMIPSVFTELATLPLTPNGKLDRAALPAPDATRPDLAGDYVAPATPAEELLATIWAKLLEVDRVGVHDSFFELGGHSLLATQVISRVREVFGTEVPLAGLFDHPTVAGLAAAIEDSAAGLAVPPVTPASRDQQLPLSFAQQRLWFIDQLEPGSAEYNVPTAVRVGGDLDVRALRAALDAIVGRHEVLRTRLVAAAAGVAHQVIDPPAPFPLPVADVSGQPSPADAARALAAADAAAPFDLAAGPLIRATLIRLAPDDHVLAMSAHHVVFDEWSGQILRRELSALYDAFRRGEPDPLPPLPAQYADFAVWQRQWLAGEVLEGQLAYWRDQLAGAPATELPADRPRPAIRSSAGAVIRFSVPGEVAGRLRGMARDGGATMFMTLLAVFAVLLGRYCDADDVVAGSPVANRNRAETEDLIGFFVNTLVIRVDLAGDPAYTDLLTRVRRTALDAYAHQDLPFEQLVDALVTERDRSRTPLFQVLFNYLTASQRPGRPGEPDPADPGGTRPQEPSPSGLPAVTLPVKFDLSVTFGETAGGLAGGIQYSTAVFDAGTVQRMAGHLVRLLAAVAADGGLPLSRLSVLTAQEREQLLAAWNDTAAAVPAVGGVHELIAASAGRHPDAVAVVCGAASMTYGGLEQRANRLAHYLRAAGTGPDSVVGLCLPRGAEMIAAILAAWKAGGAYLPLDPDYPAERLAFMLADGGAGVLVSSRAVAGGLAGEVTGAIAGQVGAGRLVWLDDPAVQAELASLPPAPPAPVHPAQLAYVIYTSGSTGTPKGVQVTHGGLVNLTAALGPLLDAGPGVTVLQFASFSFDAAARDVAVVLAAGGTLAVAAPEERAEPGLLARTISAAGVRAASVAPSLLSVLDPGELRGVRTLFSGSERVSGQVARDWSPGRRMFNAYGPTETTVISCTGVVDAGRRGLPPIGSPVANTRVYVLDRFMNPVPAGVAGELYIAGAGLARGYRRRPALTAERFVADRFAGDGSRAYRTGDRVRWLPGGALEYLGRGDDQLKVRGFRVEPGEIEAALAAHPGVRAAVVSGFGEGAQARLAAYVTPAGAHAPQAAELRAYLAKRLPEFMIPAVFTELAALPLTPTGKLDRAALPAPGAGRPGGDEYAAPSTPAQELLAGIWARVLDVGRVGAEDSFFALGGHSLLATQVISRIREVFGTEVPLAALFDRPTLAGLAAVIEDSAAGVAVPPVTLADRDKPLPLSFAQQRLWFLDQLEPGSPEYNVPMPVRLGGDLDVRALGAALGAVVRRHEVLRTRLVAGPDGVAHQVIDPPAPFPLPVADVSDTADPRTAARDLMSADAHEPFDLAAGPLIRACLVRLGPGAHLLALAVHHVVSDEWSGRILRRELSVLYEAFRRGEPDPLPPLAVQYADFAVWQRTWLDGDVLDVQLAYWRGQLAGIPMLELPADRPRPPVRSSAGAVIRFVVPGEVAGGLRELARETGATMFMTSFAAYAALLGRYAGQDDVPVGTPVANRNRAETEDLVGFFVNTLVMRADLAGDPEFAALVARVRQMALGAYAHQDLPFEQLVDALVTERDRSRSPLFQAFFNYVTAGEQRAGRGGANDRRDGGQAADDLPDGSAAEVTAKFDLRLILAEDGDRLAGGIEYSTALYDAATIERMAGHLSVLLEAAASGAGLRLSELPVLTAAEREQLLVTWNESAADVPAAGGIHELIAARAAACPDSVAVVSGRARLTYGGLWRRAGRLAGHLRGVGVGTETVVGLCLDGGVDVVTAVLATWLAGGAYLPLDPGFPPERLAFMMADSRAAVVAGTAAALEDLPVGRARTVVVDDPAMAPAPESAAPPAVHPGQMAYMMYTSGSTGRPKGVQVTHGALVNYVTAVAARARLGQPGARYALLQGTATDFGNTMIFTSLATGGVLHVIDASKVTDPAAVAGYLAGHAIDYLKIVPSHLAALSEDGLAGRLPAQVLMLGGEAAAPPLVAGLLAAADGRAVINHYGPTETTIGAVAVRLSTSQLAAGTIPIGSPMANSRLYVLDAHLNPVPAGVAGELFIGGAQLARGYGGRPALTAERFIADRFAGDGSRAYRTGDRARWRSDGLLEFLGRSDFQVKVRGFRVEPGEIEAMLAAHPGIRSAVVTADGREAKARLIAYLVPAGLSGGIPAAGELRAYLGQRLPEFMIPSVFTELAALPLTPNGKVDRAALPAPDAARPGPDDTYVAPSTPTEELLAEIWRDVLGVAQVGARDNFFELGGHSLLATQVVSRIRSNFGVDLPLAVLFDRPTVTETADAVNRLVLGIDGDGEEYEEFEL